MYSQVIVKNYLPAYRLTTYLYDRVALTYFVWQFSTNKITAEWVECEPGHAGSISESSKFFLSVFTAEMLKIVKGSVY